MLPKGATLIRGPALIRGNTVSVDNNRTLIKYEFKDKALQSIMYEAK